MTPIPRRRVLQALAAAVLAHPFAGATQTTRVRRVGWVSLQNPDVPSPFLAAFREGLNDRGYVEGRNLALEVRNAGGSRDRSDQMVIELVKSRVEVIVAQGAAVWSAHRHAGTTPVVMGFSGDPVEAKFVESLARPGRSMTGMSFLALELVGKRLEVLAQIVAPGSRVAIIADPQHPGEQEELRHSQAAAQRVGLKVGYFPVSERAQLEAALKTIATDGTHAINVFPDIVTLTHRERIAAFGVEHRLPTVSGWGTYAESGFLMSYGPNLRVAYAHLATFVDKILNGARPADLPVELPSTVEFVINARTAKAIGTRLPQGVLARADSIIE